MTTPIQAPTGPRNPWPATNEPSLKPLQGLRITETRRAAVRRARLASKRAIAPQVSTFSQRKADDNI